MSRPDLRSQVVVVLLELRALLKHANGGGELQGAAYEELRDRAFAALSGYMRRSGTAFRLGFALPEVLLGGNLLRATRAGYEAAYEVGRILEELGGTELFIDPELSVADLDAVLAAIKKAHVEGERFASPVGRLRVSGSLDNDEFEDPESPEYVSRAYAAAVVAMRDLLGELERTPLLPPRAKRVGQGLVDLSASQLTLLLAAATSDAAGNDAATNAVNAAVLSLAMLRQLTHDPRLLSHVAMAALLCDVGDAGTAAVEEDAVPAHTVAALMSLGRLNEASVVRTVVAFETQWSELSTQPVYAGRRQTTLAARVLCVVRGYLALVATEPELDLRARIDLLFSQCGDEVDRSLVLALAAALQIPGPAMKTPSVVPPSFAGAQQAASPSEAGGEHDAAPAADASGPDDAQRGEQESPSSASGEQKSPLSVSGEQEPSPHSMPTVPPAASASSPALPSVPSSPEIRVTSEPPISASGESPPPSSVLEVVDVGWSEVPPSMPSSAPAPVPPPPPTARALDVNDEPPTPSPARIKPEPPRPALRAQTSEPPPPTARAVDAGPKPRITRPVSIPPAAIAEPAARGAVMTPEAVPAVNAGEPQRPPTAQGTLSTQPVSHVLLYALDQALSGTLVFTESTSSASHRVLLERGVPVQVSTERPASRIGEVLVRLGLLSRGALTSWLRKAAEDGRGLLFGEFLLDSGALNVDELSRALEAQMVERLAALSGLPGDTQYSFYDGEDLLVGPGVSHRVRTSALNALYATLRGAIDEERAMGTLKRIWRIPLTFHADADREAYALTGEEEAVFERIALQRPTLDELLADRAVTRHAALDIVYFLAITRQLTWKGQKKGPIAPRSTRSWGPRLPPLPPRAGAGRPPPPAQGTVKAAVRSPDGVAPNLPTPPAMNAVRLEESLPPTSTASYPAVDPERLQGVVPDEPSVPVLIDSSAPPPPESTPPPSARISLPPAEFEHPNIVDPAAAARAFVTAMRLASEGDWIGATASMRRAHKLDPEDPEFAARLSRMDDTRKELNELTLRGLYERHPSHPVVATQWGHFLAEAKRPAEALRVFRALLERDPGNAEAARMVLVLRLA